MYLFAVVLYLNLIEVFLMLLEIAGVKGGSVCYIICFFSLSDLM